MKRSFSGVTRSIAPAIMLASALFVYAGNARANSTTYWLETWLDVSNAGCQYDSARRYIYAQAWGYGGAIRGNAATDQNNTVYASCGTGTLPTEFVANASYWDSSLNGFVEEQEGYSLSWGTCISATIQPAYNSSGVSCGSTSYITAWTCTS